MTDSFVLYEYLKISGVKVHYPYLEKLIVTHPDFPSLFSYADTLDQLGIGYVAVETSKHELDELQFPLIAVTPGHPNIFELIYTSNQLLEDVGLNDRWNGMVIMIEPGTVATATDYLNYSKTNEKHSKRQTGYLICLGVLCLIAALYSSWYYLLFNGLSMLGLVFAYAALLHQPGNQNLIFNRFYSRSATLNCNLVLNSRISFLKQVKIPDIGMVYFFTLLMYVAFAQNNVSLSLVLIPVASAVVLSLCLLWLQWKVLRTWCKTCIALIIIVGMQVILVLTGLYDGLSNNENIFISLLQMLMAFSLSLAWIYFKPYLFRLKHADQQEIKLLRWQRDPSIFSFLLSQQPVINNNDEISIAFGNPLSKVQVTLFVKPFCNVCAETYIAIYELFESVADIGVTLNFIVSSRSKEDSRNIAIANLLQAVSSNKPETVLLDWFRHMDLKKLEKTNSREIKGTEEFLNTPGIIAYGMETPVITINGHKLPEQYECKDLRLIIPHLL